MMEHVMEYIDETVRSSKETRELGLAVEGLLESLFSSLADGKYEVSEILEDVTENIGKVSKAAEGVDKVDDEWRLDLARSINAAGMTGLRTQELIVAFVNRPKSE